MPFPCVPESPARNIENCKGSMKDEKEYVEGVKH